MVEMSKVRRKKTQQQKQKFQHLTRQKRRTLADAFAELELTRVAAGRRRLRCAIARRLTVSDASFENT